MSINDNEVTPIVEFNPKEFMSTIRFKQIVLDNLFRKLEIAEGKYASYLAERIRTMLDGQ